MLRRSRFSFLGVVLLPALALHCSNTEEPGSLIGGGTGGEGAASAGGAPSIGGTSGRSGGAGGLMFGWEEEAGAGGQGNPDGGVLALEGCGDDVVQSGEACDDGNSVSGDGCAATCGALEQDFACPTPGALCLSTIRCGDGEVSGDELCDDHNETSGDGCSSDCQVEAGWTCSTADSPCEAATCGDGIVAGDEQCEDGDLVPAPGDGCDASCRRETDWACVQGTGSPPSTCHPTTCNDGNHEGDEPCDDGNDVVGDGCNPFCQVEPTCGAQGCQSACGDGMRLPGDAEDCDDGNTLPGDGCSASCQIETGFACRFVQGTLPARLELPVTFRDFIAFPLGAAVKHPDFETFGGSGTPGLVQSDLGPDKKPAYTGTCEAVGSAPPTCPYGQETTSLVNFDQWYRDVPTVNRTLVTTLSMGKTGSDVYQYPDTFGTQLFPLDNAGWVSQGSERMDPVTTGHNFAFTSEIRHWFEFKGGERLTFSGDDDVWVFINGKLALDLGGLHSRLERTIVLEAATGDAKCSNDVAGNTPCTPVATRILDLEVDRVYEVSLFHAERHTGFSNFDLTLGGFVSKKDECASVCGDGIRTPDEVCDDGTANNVGTYGKCAANCLSRGPNCGDGTRQTDDGEACDDGQNLIGYGATGCAPGCKLPASCGDGQINGVFGEQCDDGTTLNDGDYGGCTSTCQQAPRCGDGTRQGSEGCDDGNLLSNDGCSRLCSNEQPR